MRLVPVKVEDLTFVPALIRKRLSCALSFVGFSDAVSSLAISDSDNCNTSSVG